MLSRVTSIFKSWENFGHPPYSQKENLTSTPSYICENLKTGEPEWVSRWDWQRMDSNTSNQIITKPWQEEISNPTNLFIQMLPSHGHVNLPSKLDINVSLGEVDRETGEIHWSTDYPQWTLFDSSVKLDQGSGTHSIDLDMRRDASLTLQVTVDKPDYRALRVNFKKPSEEVKKEVTPQTELRTFAAKYKAAA